MTLPSRIARSGPISLTLMPRPNIPHAMPMASSLLLAMFMIAAHPPSKTHTNWTLPFFLARLPVHNQRRSAQRSTSDLSDGMI